MGGKTKQVQRTKNNAKPSNSGRSAELLGAAVPAFVGFSAHSDLGMIPFAPGFTTTDKLPETFDSSISSQFQLVLRKMSKKDPITKVKALQEFIELLQESDVDVVKGILPLWPKFYHNLANDVDHRVRESAQNVQNLIVSKCRKAVAPYLKQLTPVWLGSQFDNYPPAASVAASSFQTVFAPNKLQEVCLFCQQEILEYIVRNLTFHTAATLSSAKSSSPEDAENKYQRIVVSSLKLLSFFLEKTAGCDLTASVDKIQGLVAHQKFWTFAKHRTAHIKSAWFELVYNVLQYHPELTTEIKGQLIPICFQNLDESDPLIVPHVWGCILLLQNTFDDWYKSVNFKKSIQPKLSTFLRNACDGNAEAVCPNLLPFLSKITQDSLQEISLEEFHRNFFTDMKEAITSSKVISKSDCSSLTAAYYECIRFILQRLNATATSEIEQSQFILNELINNPIRWACSHQAIAVKYIFMHTSALVAYWADNPKSELYSKLIEGFWSSLADDINNKPLNEIHVENTITLINNLFWANPPLQSHKVKFAAGNKTDDDEDEDTVDGRSRSKSKAVPAYVQDDLRNLAVKLLRLCLANMLEQNSLQYEGQVRSLTKLYPDPQFYAELSEKNDLEDTLNSLAGLISNSDSEVPPSEIILEMIFEILNFMEMDKKLRFIDKLLQTKKPALQQCLLQRLLSYPMCIEPEVRKMLSDAHIIEIILQTANEVLLDDSKEKFNLLHKCFFQTDSGEILINQKTVDGILEIISKPLTNPEEYDAMIDPCGSFIAQIMPVVCSKNSSEKAQRDIFLKLFQFTIDQVKSDDLSEDTLWEITTCWQDALSSEDIIMDDELLEKCTLTISNRLSSELTCSEIHNVADLTSSLILCSTENIDDEDKRYNTIDNYLEVLFKPKDEQFNGTQKSVAKFCAYLEAMNGKIAVSELADDAGKDVEFSKFFKRSLLNLTALMKMVCGGKVFKVDRPTDDEECTEDYCDPNETLLKKWTDKMYNFTLELMKIAAQAESLVSNCLKVTNDLMVIMLEFSEKVKLLLQGLGEVQVEEIKDRILKDAAFNDTAATRAIPFLTQIPQYAQFEESALLLLIEELTEYFLTRESLASYVNLLQFTLQDLSPKVINQENPILRRSSDIWHKCVIFQLLIRNNFNQETNEISDRQIIALALNYITEVSENQKKVQKEQLLHNTDVSKQDFVCITRTVEFINLLTEVLERFPSELTIKNWDAIRLGLSSWVLSIAKSMNNYKNSKVSIFVTAVYKLHQAFANFIKTEKTKSSTEMLSSVIDEWENLFSAEVNIVLFRRFYNFASENCDESNNYSTCYLTMLNEICPSIQSLNYAVVFKFSKVNQEFTLQDLVKFLLDKISSPVHSLRITALNVLVELSQFFIANDKEMFEKTTDLLDAKAGETSTMPPWHFLSRFKEHLELYETAIVKYLDEFSFKLTELPEMKPIDREEALSYLFLWDCVINVCANAPVELRSIYTSWLTENKFDQKFLHFLFRAMPVEILKNHDSKLMNNELFKSVNWTKSKSENIQIDKYACQLYSMALSKLPAVVRKWWNGTYSRQKVFVDKLTTNFVSEIICHDELSKLGKINDKDKHNNMQVTVHTSTREVNAVYNIDEARMELIITLAANYPLGGVKVESGKQIGGRASSRNIAMQLTIFITHQNGSIFDGLSLWKNNLDKKFEGVEECYVCYTVIHQDTCQLPKLTCKTCRKKFHSPCLYKWFTTSSKSTCPLCRNIF